MPVDPQSGLIVSKAYGPVECLGLDSSRLALCMAELQRRQFLGVFGTPATGFRETTLEALRGQHQLQAVTVIDADLRSIDALYELPDLRYLRLQRSRAPMEFARLTAIEQLIWTYSPRDSGLAALRQLSDLRLWHYAHPAKSFAPLDLPPSLERLDLTWSNVRSLQGLSTLPVLRRLELHRCRELDDLAGLAEACPQLEHIEISACGRLTREHCEQALAPLRHLKIAILQHKPLALAT